MAKVVWINAAIGDLQQVFSYVAGKLSPVRAEEICDDILSATDQLERFPDSGTIVPELTYYQAREIYRHSYRMIYVHRGDGCYIVFCVHSSRDLIRSLDASRWDELP